MDQVVRLDEIRLHSADRADELEAFVRTELFPTLASAYGGLTRKTISSLVKQVLMKDSREPGKYTWLSSWLGPAGSLKDMDLDGVSMEWHEKAEMALLKLDQLGERSGPSVFEQLVVLGGDGPHQG